MKKFLLVTGVVICLAVILLAWFRYTGYGIRIEPAAAGPRNPK